MKLLINIILFGSLFAQSIDGELHEQFIESLVDDLNSQKNNSVIKRIDESMIIETDYANHAKILKLKAYYNLKDFDTALNVAKSMNPLNYSPNLKTSFYLTMGDIYSSKGYYDHAFKNYIDARRSNIDSRSKRVINKRLVKIIPLNLDFENLELMEILEDNKSNLNIILLAQSFSLVYSNSQEISRKFDEIDQRTLDREFRSNYNFLKRNIDSKTSFSKKVGVVLPLDGEGLEITNAFLKGLLEANQSSQSNDKIQFIVIDNYQDPILTVEAFKNLVEKHNVSAIIGPFLDKNLIAGASSVSSTKIPIFAPFTSLENLSSVNKNIYLLNSSVDFRNELLVSHYLDNSELNNIAVIAPRTDLGVKEVDSFLIALDKLNKEPVYIGWYEENSEIDLRPNFNELREVAWEIETRDEYQEFLGVEIDVLDSMFEVDNDEVYDMFNLEQEESIDSTKVILETIDGLFYPVSSNALEFVASQVSLSNLETQLLGNENWLNLDLLKQESVSPHISDMLFASNYIPKYLNNSEYDYDPSLNNIFHFGMDFSNFLINSSFNKSKFDFRSSSNFEGITRNFDFSNSTSNKGSKVVRFSNRKIYNSR
ncbi:ABC transporter substrate-binding protein [Candidatus Marinimicrobia bacterium]|nr:ABC transporter substrate-binding protein [Candidatus Neomarinimicrobiota bacterium]MDA9735375.1 ABC transporter substrate-binding protein [Candidatus Neomarinimicrobiota bacterium]